MRAISRSKQGENLQKLNLTLETKNEKVYCWLCLKHVLLERIIELQQLSLKISNVIAVIDAWCYMNKQNSAHCFFIIFIFYHL